MTTPEHESAPVRLDKWLWAARFFKTRALATEAVNGGKVHLGGQRVKPARAVHVGDELTIRKGPDEFRVIVRGIRDRRGPASVAQTLYEETEASRRDREDAAALRRAQRASMPIPDGRPTKKDRRAIRRFKESGR